MEERSLSFSMLKVAHISKEKTYQQEVEAIVQKLIRKSSLKRPDKSNPRYPLRRGIKNPKP
jgi:hypothetical protein